MKDISLREFVQTTYIEQRNADYDMVAGPLTTPEQLVGHHIHMSRQTGKTRTMLANLPNSRCIIIVHRLNYGRDLLRTLVMMRPNYDRKNIIFVSYNELAEAKFDRTRINRLRGYPTDLPIFVDSAVLDEVQYDFIKQINWSPYKK